MLGEICTLNLKPKSNTQANHSLPLQFPHHLYTYQLVIGHVLRLDRWLEVSNKSGRVGLNHLEWPDPFRVGSLWFWFQYMLLNICQSRIKRCKNWIVMDGLRNVGNVHGLDPLMHVNFVVCMRKRFLHRLIHPKKRFLHRSKAQTFNTPKIMYSWTKLSWSSRKRFEPPWQLSSMYEKPHSFYSLDYHLYFKKHNIKCCIKQTI